jgi:apolipoprotein N-acyltransferase
VSVILLALLSALLILLSFPPFNWAFLSFFSLIPFLYCLAALSEKPLSFRSFGVGWFFGIVVMGGFHFWMFSLKAFAPLWGVFGLWFLASCLYGLFFGGVSFLICYLRLRSMFAFPAIWVIFEWLRALGPFGNPAATLGYTQTAFLPILQLASFGGIYFVSFFVVFINILLFRRKILWAFLLFFSVWIWGSYRMSHVETPQKTVQAYVIQSTFKQTEKWSYALAYRIQSYYLDKISQLPSSQTPAKLPDLELPLLEGGAKDSLWIVCPETITPFFNLQDTWFMSQLTAFSREKNRITFFGTPYHYEGRFYNAIAAISSDPHPDVYCKNHLIPFGEYWPFRSTLELIALGSILPKHEYSPAATLNALQVGSYTVASAVCLESLFPWLIRPQIREGGDAIVVVANHAWYFDSSAAEKHLQISRARAVEFNRSLLLSSNMGISAIVDPRGRLLSVSQLNHEATLRGPVFIGLSNTCYTLFGDWILWLCFVIVIGDVMRQRYLKKSRTA